jgi:drug/metabolite transporter (DMT)-like permease
VIVPLVSLWLFKEKVLPRLWFAIVMVLGGLVVVSGLEFLGGARLGSGPFLSRGTASAGYQIEETLVAEAMLAITFLRVSRID